ncbi:C40 family peptidase [Arthrobacter castelli]|uniref:C40 family peptidase n=1 Tax=Arthrobacter castelli TaxID=271431 RepID=UPI00047B8B6E|nr:LysM peptidoglycan-binding domain-containing protein [Arthrobacter castelli]
MSKNVQARHRALAGNTSAIKSVSNAVTSQAGVIGRSAAVVGAASALMLGIGAPAQAGATDAGSSSASSFSAASTSAAASGAPAAPAQTGLSTHTVQSGDTLALIAQQHGVSLDAVLAANGLSLDSVIYPGDTIQIPGASGSASGGASAGAAATASAPATGGGGASVSSDAGSSVSTVSSDVTEIPSSGGNAAMLSSAQSQLGAIQDCTALVEQALQAAGVSGVGDESVQSLLQFASPVSSPQPGDIAYYADGGAGVAHIAIYIGDGEAIHSGWEGNKTVVESVDVGSGPVFYRV